MYIVKKSNLGDRFLGVLATKIVRGLESSSRVLTNASELRVRQGSGQLNIKATTHG